MSLFCTYEGNTYLVLGPTRFKDPKSRKWLPAIRYENSKGMEFVREQEEFINRFEMLTDDQSPDIEQWRRTTIAAYEAFTANFILAANDNRVRRALPTVGKPLYFGHFPQNREEL